MRTLIYRNIILSLLIAGFTTLPAPVAMSKTINVTAGQSTVQEAVNTAAPGDEIVLSDGVYDEPVVLNLTGGITIRSETPGGATINGGTEPVFTAADFAGDIIIRDLNLKVDPGTAAVLQFANVSGTVVLQGNTFVSDYGGHGVDMHVSGSIESRLELRDNIFDSPADPANGINVTISDNPQFDLIAEFNYFENMQHDGISVITESTGALQGAKISTRIFENDFINWIGTGNAISIHLSDSVSVGNRASVLIEKNTMKMAGDGSVVSNAGGNAVKLNIDGTEAAADVIIRKNWIHDPGINAIYVISDDTAENVTANILIHDNEIVNPQYSGIEVESQINPNGAFVNHNVVVTGNVIGSVGLCGFMSKAYLSDSSYTLNIDLRGNRIGAGLDSQGEALGESGFSDYAFWGSNSTITNIGQGVSASLDLIEVIRANNEGHENTTDQKLVYCLNTENVVESHAVLPNQISAVLGGMIWNDQNGDGNQDSTQESEMPLIPVMLNGTTNRGEMVDMSSASDTNGLYLFPALLPGNYTLTVIPPADYGFSLQFVDPGGTGVDANFDPDTGDATVSFTIDDQTVDAGLWIDPNTTDDDKDGYTEEQGDCNDEDANINPAAIEVCGNAIDDNCDGLNPLCPEDIDDDFDGFTENQGDCDDSDADVNPGATDICGDGIDQDCSGGDEPCSVQTMPPDQQVVPTISDLQGMVDGLNTRKWIKRNLNKHLKKAQKAFDKGRIKQGRKRIVKFMRKLVHRSNYKHFRRHHIARDEADKLIMAAAETLTGQTVEKTHSIADMGSMVAGLKTRYRTKASLSYRLFAADWASRLGFQRFSRNILIGFISKAVNCCDYRGRKSSHRISIEESNQLVMAGASALVNLSWK